MITRTCSKCKFTYWGEDAVRIAFRQRPGTSLSWYRLHTMCNLCRQDKRTSEKRADRWIPKARRTRKAHAKKLGYTVEEMETRFGWILPVMAHNAEYAYANGCPECHESFLGMGHGTRDIELDIQRRGDLPYYGDNTKWMCATCNRSKGALSLEDWALKKSLYRQRAKFLEETKYDPRYGRNWEQLALIAA